ncbi:hypothetical protein RJ641_020730, partial [Dillenia turbinata]
KPDGLCISQGGRFPPFTNEGKPPGRVKKGPKDLTLCRVFRRKTCCDVSQTYPALITIRKLAVTGEASQECLHLWEMLECSICDPCVGLQPGPPVTHAGILVFLTWFAVKSVGIGIEETSCYGGKASLDSIVDSWKASQSEVNQESEKPGGWKISICGSKKCLTLREYHGQ